jgi:hypothetical protein
MVGSANRDERQFPDVGVFDIGRDPNPHIAFSHGIHFCLGAAPWPPSQALNVHGPASLPIRFGKMAGSNVWTPGSNSLPQVSPRPA